MTAMQTERGFDRMVNFCDAVVAIAITLLVLPLVDIPSELIEGQPIFSTSCWAPLATGGAARRSTSARCC